MLRIPFLGVWWFWLCEVVQGYRVQEFFRYDYCLDDIRAWEEKNKAYLYRRRFFLELGFLDGLRSQPFVY